jgi:multiple sugar transport system substrate-binding protein
MDWLRSVSKPFEGKKLVAALELEPAPLALQRMDPDFHDHTGTLVGYELTPFIQNLVNTSLAVSTKAPTYDIMNVDGSNLARFKNHLIPPAELAEEYPDFTYQNLDSNDFHRAGLAFSGKYPQDLIFPPYERNMGGSIFMWPQDMPVMIRFYRKDLYEREGITPGRTWDEYFEDVKMFDDPSNGIFGAGSMALAHPSIIFEYLSHLYSFGGKIWEIDDNNRLTCVISSDSAVAALENFVRLKNYSDPASASSTWAELGILMAVGRVANAIQWADYASIVNNPVQSLTPGDWGFTPNPAGPAGSFSSFGGAGVGVSRYSRNPEAAWLWLQWATSFGTQVVSLQDPIHYYTPTRTKVQNDTVISQEIETGRLKYLEVVNDVISTNKMATLVAFSGWQEVRLILGDVLARTWQGSLQPRNALKEAQEKIDRLGPIFQF